MKKNGFTLIELMIVVTIISILAAVAIPAYQDHSLKEGCKNGDRAACTELATRHKRVQSNQQQNVQPVTPEASQQVPPAQVVVPCYAGYVMLPDGHQLIGANGGGVQCQN